MRLGWLPSSPLAEALKGDRAVVEAAVHKTGEPLIYASQELKADHNIVKNLVVCIA